MLELHY